MKLTINEVVDNFNEFSDEKIGDGEILKIEKWEVIDKKILEKYLIYWFSISPYEAREVLNNTKLNQ